MRTPGVRWPHMLDLNPLSVHQRDELACALSRSIGVLAGTPGTGKTYSMGSVVSRLVHEHGRDAVAVCAPTGKAAVRLSSALSRFGVPLTARTIHSLLEVDRYGHDGDGWGFQQNASNPLEQQFVIVDEASMLDTDLFASLLDACAPGSHLLLVGDPYQLPPVGHGAPLRDMIASGVVPVGLLTEIRRNAGSIVRACAAIKDGQRFDVDDVPNIEAGKNLYMIECVDPVRQVESLIALFASSFLAGLNRVWDVQVLVPTNDSGSLGRKELNQRLQAEFNPTGERCEGNPYRVGDKIICLRNHWALSERQHGPQQEVYVANGEQGSVEIVQAKHTVAAFANPARVIRIPHGKPQQSHENDEAGSNSDFDLGYAITCHKSQGSEWPVVIVMIDAGPGARRVCSREWLYTAISRASHLCVLIGREGVAQQMTKRPALDRRKTFLAELLRAK